MSSPCAWARSAATQRATSLPAASIVMRICERFDGRRRLDFPALHPQEQNQQSPQVITEVGAPLEMRLQHLVDGVPLKNPRGLHVTLAESLDEQRLESGSQ